MAPFIAAIAITPVAWAQPAELPPPIPDPGYSPTLPVDFNLWNAEQIALSLGPANPALPAELENRRIDFDLISGIPWLLVEITADEGFPPLSPAFVSAVGGDAEPSWEGILPARVPIDQVSAFGFSLPDGYFVNRPMLAELDEVIGEGPVVTNARDYRVAGMRGAGVTVAVIDSGFAGFAAARANQDAPPAGNTTMDPLGHVGTATSTHGTSCVESLYDYVYDAQYRLYPTRGLAHLGKAVDDIIAHKNATGRPVVISHSMSWFNTGWHDGSGDACKAAERAAAAGIPFITAAGNRAEQHYQADGIVDTNGNKWHEFPDGTEDLPVAVPAGRKVTFYLQWDNVADNATNYDLYLYTWTAATGYVQVASSTNWSFLNWATQRFESITWTNTGGAARTVYLGVWHQGGTSQAFEVFTTRDITVVANRTAWNSTASPSNATNSLVLPIAAVDHRCYTPGVGGCPGNAADPIEPYSSRGPTNNGVWAIAITGPACQSTFTDGANGFCGTSCATPSVAGLMALIRSGKLALPWTTIRDQFYDWARRFRDWPPAGYDRWYGEGGAILPNVRILIQPNRPHEIRLVANRPNTIKVALLGSAQYIGSDIRESTLRLVYTDTYNPIRTRYLDVNGDGFEDAVVEFELPANFPTGMRTFALFGEWLQVSGRQLPWAGIDRINVIGPPAPLPPP
ncbi:MAG: S8 family serine peptidase [Planctomycetes bacterium]|nr:S8 family serine peptidase [Planctomycetota bacterium]